MNTPKLDPRMAKVVNDFANDVDKYEAKIADAQARIDAANAETDRFQIETAARDLMLTTTVPNDLRELALPRITEHLAYDRESKRVTIKGDLRLGCFDTSGEPSLSKMFDLLCERDTTLGHLNARGKTEKRAGYVAQQPTIPNPYLKDKNGIHRIGDALKLEANNPVLASQMKAEAERENRGY